MPTDICRRLSVREKVLAVLGRAARHGKPCPTNTQIADAVRVRSTRQVVESMRVLEDAGLIRREVMANQARRVTIVATGESTDWSRKITSPSPSDPATTRLLWPEGLKHGDYTAHNLNIVARGQPFTAPPTYVPARWWVD